jgi:hypothetical protein
MARKLLGKIALVTGGSVGIGLASPNVSPKRTRAVITEALSLIQVRIGDIKASGRWLAIE